MYVPNNHTCSVIPIWRVDNSVLFLYPWKDGENKLKFLIRVEKGDMSHGWLQKYFFLLKMPIN